MVILVVNDSVIYLIFFWSEFCIAQLEKDVRDDFPFERSVMSLKEKWWFEVDKKSARFLLDFSWGI